MKLFCRLITFSFIIISFSSCRKTEIMNVEYDFGKFTNHIMQADLTEALYRGIEIPTKRQIPSGNFKISFDVKGNRSKKYFYKIYYQNESYKFPENKDTTKLHNPLASENFYGSWEDTVTGFKSVSSIEEKITDSIKIIGNPRNEKKYFGQPFEKSFSNEDSIHKTVKNIKATKEWYASIVAKAKQNKLSIDEQLILDAKWSLKNNDSKSEENNRWKRNPRMGKYSLMIVVTSETDLKKIPSCIQHINQTSPDGNFISPYWFFSDKINKDSFPDTKVFLDSNFVTVNASLNLASGIYADGLEYPGAGKIPAEGSCGWNKDLYMNAQFAQFFTTAIKFPMNTIPLLKDVNDSSYTLEEYQQAEKKFSSTALKKDFIRNTENPCANVRYDENKKAIEIINPGNKNLSDAHKSNMGIKSRIGFTYGKITAKIKFPELINKYNVWDGLTNAFWLLFQDEGKWNYRRTCNSGYTKKGDGRNDAPRSPQTYYSEIDFELVKTSRYWPNEYYKVNPDLYVEDAQKTDDIVVACTNWDMTCKDCRWYTVGLDSVHFDSTKYEIFRWDNGYQALTTRTPAKDDELFKSPYYYYQFEWTPNYIIWRIGPEKNKLRVVGYMAQDITSIPNNQMIAVITQEYHLSEWWPPIPFKQEYIPFPKRDIMGELYELTIE
ncbi:MAG: hypothetical protein HY063_02065 [Bacteroidetes bacterium]|nr:hypothetical protein [Bacteroidota bacterium]